MGGRVARAESARAEWEHRRGSFVVCEEYVAGPESRTVRGTTAGNTRGLRLCEHTDACLAANAHRRIVLPPGR
eukprot:6790178-Prymnesium_polylepis.1